MNNIGFTAMLLGTLAVVALVIVGGQHCLDRWETRRDHRRNPR